MSRRTLPPLPAPPELAHDGVPSASEKQATRRTVHSQYKGSVQHLDIGVEAVWGNFVNMRSIQENGELKIESKIEEIIEPLREKIRDLEKSFTQKYPPVKFLSEKDRKRILITGGAGFVGSHLTDKLMMDGHEVTVVDNFFTGRKRNVEHWIGHENFELINHDVVEPLYIEVDQIYHLASPASPPNYMYNPIKTLKTNTIGTLNMLDPEVHPQSEDYWGHVNPIGPRACYDEGKRVAETMCYAYMKQEGVEVRVARIFNTFGPRMHMNDGRVVSNFILQALQGEPLTVSTAQQTVSTAQHTVSTAQQTVSTAQHTVSTAQHTASTAQQTVSTAQHTVSTAQHTVSTAQHTVSTAQQTVSTAQHTVSTAQHTVSTAQHTASTAQQTVSTAQHTVSTAQHTDSEYCPADSEYCPAHSEYCPAHSEYCPAHSEYCPADDGPFAPGLNVP
uniref:UDP-glucuronate decarboxylase 1 n=1 Tax=Rattus norvegicus TaxID=10116 RepID=A0ABK0L987_RAT